MEIFRTRLFRPETSGQLRPKSVSKRLRPFVFFAAFLALSLPAFALQITPTYQVLETKAGDKTSGFLTLVNNHEEVVSIQPGVREWVQTARNKKTPVEKWLKVDQEPFDLKPGESKKIRFDALVPKSAKGEMIGMLTFTTQAKGEIESKEGAMITMRISVAVYVAVTGTEKIDQKVDNITVEISSNTMFAVKVRNTGNCHTRPKGWLYIDDEKGNRVLNVELETGIPTYPETTRIYNGILKNYILPAGKYSARVEMEDVDRALKYSPQSFKMTVSPQGRVEVR